MLNSDGSGDTACYPALVGAALRLLAFFDLDDLVGAAAMRLTVYSLSRPFARHFAQSEDGTSAFVLPILQVLYTVLALNCKVFLVGLYACC